MSDDHLNHDVHAAGDKQIIKIPAKTEWINISKVALNDLGNQDQIELLSAAAHLSHPPCQNQWEGQYREETCGADQRTLV